MRAVAFEVHAASGVVAREPVADVEVLLEVVAKREVEERAPVRRQLHRSGQTALDDGEVAGGKVPVQLVHVGAHLEPLVRRERRRVDARTCDDDHPQRGDELLRLREGSDHAPQEVGADARAADGDDADLLVLAIAELVPERGPVGELGGIETRDVAREAVVLLGPLADLRQVRSEPLGHDVLWVADEDGLIAQAREARDVLDHLLVVVAGQERLVLAAVRHRQPADEVGEPRVRRPLLLGVFVQVVVELPRLVADPEVVLLVADEVMEDHEVREQDLVHAPDRVEAVQVVLGRLALDVTRFVGEERARRMDLLAASLEHRRHGMLGEPVDLEVGVEVAQLVGDRGVALRVAETDGGGDEERALAA